MNAPYSRILAATLFLSGTSSVSAAPATPAPAASADCGASGGSYSADAQGAACRLADELEKAFVYPDKGKAYAAALRAHVAAGKYRGMSVEDASRTMTADLQAVAPDGHLHVMRLPDDSDGPSRAGPRADFPLLEQSGWIAPGIAFIRINAFMRDPAETAAVAKFMADHADAKAIIFDIRTHRGGGLDQMDVIFPWLFAKETRLVTMAIRRSVEEEQGSPLGDTPSLRLVAGTPQEVVREHWATPNADPRLRDAKVYLLTSRRTGSAAEHFALAMKHTGRATLVGSRTSGANHFGGGMELAGGLAAFVPVGRTYDPVTGKDWESVGVAPDVDVAPEVALEWALKDLGVDAATASGLSKSHAPTLSMEPRKM